MTYILANRPAAERLDIVTGFLDSLSAEEAAHAQRVAGEIAGCRPLASTVAAIPVAAHQEAPQIMPAMNEFARQMDTADPFSIVLNLNCPSAYKDSPDVQATLGELERARTTFPQLDIRSFFRTYGDPRQGKIRRDPWNGILQAAVEWGQIDEHRSVVILNQDIDLIRMRRGSIGTVQHEYTQLTADSLVLPIGAMPMAHAKSPRHPNIATAVSWIDYMFHARGIAFEAGLIIPTEMYALFRGFRPTTRIGEVAKIVNEPELFVRGSHATTSPRRYLDRIHEDGFSIWRVETFSATDACRVTADDQPDISREYALQLIEGTLDNAGTLLGQAVLKGVLRDCEKLSLKDPDSFRGLIADKKAIENLIATRLDRLAFVSQVVLRDLTRSPAMVEKFCVGFRMNYAEKAALVVRMLTDPTAYDPEQL